MGAGALILAGVGAVLTLIGTIALRRKQPLPRPWQPSDGISLIELGVSAVDPNFVPAGEMRWEQHVNRLICWFGLFAGIALVCVGLWFGLSS